jgi:branched-chain amino acid aminotransferase|tara:strand:- start:261 stop:1253 length:993 start_codon:yes stop_codon:yes gene_type:complete
MKNKKTIRTVYFNGDFVPETEARISIYDSALMFGDMVFEMTRSFNGKQFKLKEHLQRLYTGIKILRIPMKLSIEEMENAVHKTVEKNLEAFDKDDEHRILIDISRGILSIYEDVDIKKGPNVVIADFPLKWTVQNCSHLYDEGINLCITSQRAIPAHLMEPKIKNRSRLFYLMANIEVSMIKGNDNWALLLDTNGFIAEGTGSNFFMVKDNMIFLPEERDMLRGISMNTVVKDLAPALGIKVVHKNIEPFDVYEADEVFLTSTPFCILPAVTLNKLKIGDGKPGVITKKLIKAWSDLVGVDIVKQIKSWDLKQNKKPGTTPYKFSNGTRT